ncbi:BolA family protein [Candidatus Cyanaurora vandensis]|uniref:BolA family protein n=1 Tax=Candidatus Cyanaurora vandensis TaxID=2714958 RepID=UPI00257C0C91|nr:BolA family transcriptional regulator [Candidatus Cyanaurora vandensis]
MDPASIAQTLNTAFPTGTVQVRDLTGGGDHFQALVVAPQFEGKNLVEQHQLVYAALGDLMRERIHALALQTYTPAQWEKLQ